MPALVQILTQDNLLVIFVGSNITASMEVSASSNLANLYNTAVIGSGLIVSGTMGASSLSASMFVGQYNETGSLADPTQVKFAVGAGTSNTARKTAFYVSASGDVVVKPNTTGYGRSLFTDNAVRIGDGVINGGYATVVSANGTFVTNGGNIASGQTNVLIAGEVNTITAARSSAIIAGSYNTLNTTAGLGDTNNVILGSLFSTIAYSNSKYTGIYSSTGSIISGSQNSVIIAGNEKQD